ncbi:MAG TPA: 4a-hydroxytetrahydrobiopterin dehydratase [Ktedonobacterales bacterium]
MNTLAMLTCVPCRRGEAALTDAEVATMRAEVPDWQLVPENGIPTLRREFRPRDFAAALALADAVGAAAEAQGHHPRLVVEWGRLTVQWWTHAIGGLHRNDFIMAARTDALVAAQAGS